ncbi:MAG: hypothetical protein ACRC30_15785 [Clostridium sp.]
MTVKNDILKKYDDRYMAQYGWRKNFDDETFTFRYIDSYKNAADEIVELLIPDLYIFPIIFSYRQYLELVLKNICYKQMEKEVYM